MVNKISTKQTTASEEIQMRYEEKIASLQEQVNSVYAFHSKEIEQKENAINRLRNLLESLVNDVKALTKKPEDTFISEMFKTIEERHHTDILERIHRYKQAIRFFKSKLNSLLQENDLNVLIM